MFVTQNQSIMCGMDWFTMVTVFFWILHPL